MTAPLDTTVEDPHTTEPIWAQKPTTWKVADTWVQVILDRLSAEDNPLLKDDDTGIPVLYWTNGVPGHESMTVCIHADLDGFIVNAYTADRYFGPDLLPLSPRGLGIPVPNRLHPKTGDEWFTDIYPQLLEAVTLGVEAVAAIRDGQQCPSVAGINTSEYPCQRPAGHADTHPDVWADHANSQIIWTDDAVTSSHPGAVVLR